MRCCWKIDFNEFSLLEIEKRISEISDQRPGSKEETGKCDEEENCSVLRWRGCDETFCGKTFAGETKRENYTENTEGTEVAEKRKAKALTQR
jgi:hypothetical protein